MQPFLCLIAGLVLTLLAWIGSSIWIAPALALDLDRVLIPIGADHNADTLALFVQQAIAHNQDSIVEIRLLIPPLSPNSFFVGFVDRQNATEAGRNRVDQIQSICLSLVMAPVTCHTTAPNIQIRTEAQDAANLTEFNSTVDGVYILEGNQAIAMQIIANTPLEDILETLYRSGVPLAGSSAGAAVQSRYMISGYQNDHFAWNGLELGSLDLAYGVTGRTSRGLRFGLSTAILDQDLYQQGRLLRLLQAVEQSPVPKLGLGVDNQTGIKIINERWVEGTMGLTSAIIVDLETFQSANQAQYQGDRKSLSIHNVPAHLLPAGDYAYDLELKQPLRSGVAIEPPLMSTRSFEFLNRPAGSAPIIVAGDLLQGSDASNSLIPFIDTFANQDVPNRFAELARKAGFNVTVLAVGENPSTLEAATRMTKGLRTKQLKVKQEILTPTSNLAALEARLRLSDAIAITSVNQVEVALLIDHLHQLHLDQMNRAGTVLLFDNAAAAAIGEWMIAEETPADTLTAKEARSTSGFLTTYPSIQQGLGLVTGANFEPRAFYDYRYGRLVNLIYHHPDTVAFGIERETGLELTAEGATVLGPAAVLSIDGRYAAWLESGQNGAIGAYWLFLDTYTTDESLS